jgi:hypothetical protein
MRKSEHTICCRFTAVSRGRLSKFAGRCTADFPPAISGLNNVELTL